MKREEIHYARAVSLVMMGDKGHPAEIGYLDAVDRIEDFTDDVGNPYYLAPHEDLQYIPGGDVILIGPDCEPLGPDEARMIAFELLVLADMAEQ